MKLLLVTDAWRPKINGVVTALAKIKDLLERDGFEVVVIHPGLFRCVSLPGYPEIRLAFSPWLMRRLFMSQEPDFIHIATEGPLGWNARALCRRHQWSFTTSYHTHFHLYAHVRMRSFFRPVQALIRTFHDGTACTMVATPSLKHELEGNGYRNLALWPLGVDASVFVRNPSPKVPRLPKPVFVFFSRLAAEKNPEEFLQLDLPGTKLVIGDGPERKRIERRFEGQATFLGFKHGRELVDWLSICDAMIFPSRTETFGLVILEALACGIPIAAHDVMGPRDILDNGADGMLGEDLKEAALACLTLDPGRCREKALRYSWDASATAFKKNLVASGARATACDGSAARLRGEISL